MYSRQQSIPNKLLPFVGGSDGKAGIGRGGGNEGWSGGAEGDGNEFGNDSSKSSGGGFGLLGLFLNGWRSRVAADPQFTFKVLMEELVGVTTCVLGDMGCLCLRLRV
nr:protein reticulata-related 3, chloroplastic [Quercus suber]